MNVLTLHDCTSSYPVALKEKNRSNRKRNEELVGWHIETIINSSIKVEEETKQLFADKKKSLFHIVLENLWKLRKKNQSTADRTSKGRLGESWELLWEIIEDWGRNRVNQICKKSENSSSQGH